MECQVGCIEKDLLADNNNTTLRDENVYHHKIYKYSAQLSGAYTDELTKGCVANSRLYRFLCMIKIKFDHRLWLLFGGLGTEVGLVPPGLYST